MKRGAATHMPFGAGPRTCIGMKFSLTMIKMALIAILRHYTFVLSPKTEVRCPLYQPDYCERAQRYGECACIIGNFPDVHLDLHGVCVVPVEKRKSAR